MLTMTLRSVAVRRAARGLLPLLLAPCALAAEPGQVLAEAQAAGRIEGAGISSGAAEADPAANRRPIARADAVSTAVDTARRIRVLRNDRDPEGAALSVTALGRPDQGGRVRIIDATQVRYLPAAGFEGTEQFSYTISDGSLSATATVTVTVGEAAPAIDCTPVQQEVQGSGGCRLALVSPPNCGTAAADWRFVQIEWSTGNSFCESPHHLYIASHPAAGSPVWDISMNETGGNERAIGSNGSVYALTRNLGGYLRLARADFDAIRQQLPASTTGQYHFAVTGFYALDNGGSISESRTRVFPP